MSVERFPREFDMRKPVVSWLIGNGYSPAVEFQLWHMVDIVAGRFAPRQGRSVPLLLEAIAIELKLENVASVIKQAVHNRHRVDWSFCAMPVERIQGMKRGTFDKFRSNLVGLISVGDTIEVVVPPVRNKPMNERTSRQLWRRTRKVYAEMQPQ